MIQIKNTSFFQPIIISGCQLWLDGADPAGNGTIPANGATVSTWIDKSTNGLTVSAASSQPTYVTNVVNGRGTVAFNGSQNLSAGSVTAGQLLGSTGTSATFCVFSISDNNSASTPISWDDGSYTWRFLIHYDSSGLTFDLGNASAGVSNRRISISNSTLTFANNTYYLVSFWQSGGAALLNVNGGAYTANTPSGFTGNIPTSTSRTFNVGTYINSSGYNMKGNTAEVIIYNTHIPSNFQQIEGYLAWKWGLQGSLPSTHPFARSASFASSLYFPRAIPKVIGTTVKNPLAIQGLQLWLDAADTSSMTLSGSTVTQWRDKSGVGNSPTVYSGVSYSTGQQNNLGTINLGNYSGSMTGTITPSLQNSVMSCFFVFKLNGTSSDNGSHSILVFSNPGSGDLRTVEERNGNFRFLTFNPSVVILSTPAISGSYVLWFSGQNTTNMYARLNGTSLTSASISTNTRNSSQYAIGTNLESPLSTPTGWNGYVAEMVVYNSLLSVSQQEEIEGYLAWKWGLQGSLPVGHPYKSAGPAIVPYVTPVVRSITTIGSPVRIITTGLVSRWQLNESSGSTVIDSVGGNNITIGDSPSRVSVTYGSYTGFALSLQTTSQVGSISLPSNLNVVAHSMTSWVYFTALRGQQRWLSWGNSGCGGGGEDFSTYLNTLYHGPTCIVAYSFLTSGLTTGVWYFCVSTYNGTTWTTYLNGTQIQSANAGFGAVNGFFSIGYNRDSAQTLGGNGGGGYLGEIRFYNRALTAEEVLRIYQGTG